MSAISPAAGIEREQRQRERGYSPLTVGGVTLALGAVGVTVTSILYALSPQAAVLPVQPFELAPALSGAVTRAHLLFAAGTVGIFADIVMAVGALLIVIELVRREQGVAAAGWVAIFLSIVLFIFVDITVGYVLAPAAATPGGGAVFAAFKRFFDVLFLLGTITFGAGAIQVVIDDLRSSHPVLSRAVALVAGVAGLAGLVAAAGCFAGLPWQRGVGLSIGLGSAIFAVVGVQIARAKLFQL